MNPACKRCGALETELHVLFHCPFAAKVWELAPCMFKPSALGASSIASLLHNCQKMMSLPPVGLGKTPLYPWILWVLWTNRNKFVFENLNFSEQESILKAIQDAKSWKKAQELLIKPSLPQCVGVPLPPPDEPSVNAYAWYCFSDAA